MGCGVWVWTSFWPYSVFLLNTGGKEKRQKINKQTNNEATKPVRQKPT